MKRGQEPAARESGGLLLEATLAGVPRGQQAAALMARLRSGVRSGSLPAGTRLPASRTLAADLAGVDGVGWRVLTPHLDLHVGSRRRQFETLLDEILPATTVPTIVVGDFNEWWPFSRGLSALRRHAILPFAPGP